MSAEELEPCPFCGGGQFDHKADCFFQIVADVSHGRWAELSDDDFDRAWNSRAQSVAHIEAAVLRALRLEMDDFDPADSPAFMAGQIKCISILDRLLERDA
jgi:hypothetical protein